MTWSPSYCPSTCFPPQKWFWIPRSHAHLALSASTQCELSHTPTPHSHTDHSTLSLTPYSHTSLPHLPHLTPTPHSHTSLPHSLSHLTPTPHSQTGQPYWKYLARSCKNDRGVLVKILTRFLQESHQILISSCTIFDTYARLFQTILQDHARFLQGLVTWSCKYMQVLVRFL